MGGGTTIAAGTAITVGIAGTTDIGIAADRRARSLIGVIETGSRLRACFFVRSCMGGCYIRSRIRAGEGSSR